jgi:hypothetical protein
MAAFRSPVFLICLVIFLVHQVLQKVLNIHYPLLDHYLDNILAMPVILTFFLAEKRWLFKKGNEYALSTLEIVIATIYIIIVTELIFPLFSDKFKGDWLDVILYAIGSIIFYYTINKSGNVMRTSHTEKTP